MATAGPSAKFKSRRFAFRQVRRLPTPHNARRSIQGSDDPTTSNKSVPHDSTERCKKTDSPAQRVLVIVWKLEKEVFSNPTHRPASAKSMFVISRLEQSLEPNVVKSTVCAAPVISSQ